MFKGSGSRSRIAARRALARKGLLARQHLVQDAAEAEQIAARVGFFALELLGRHVLEGAEDLSLLCERARYVRLPKRCVSFCQPEVEQLDSLLRHQNVGNLFLWLVGHS